MIDAHVHVWDLAAADYGWPNESVPEIFRDIRLEELLPQLERSGIHGVVLVQADDTAEDTQNMLRTADRRPEVLGVVGWIELDADVDAVESDLLDLRRHPRVVGIRNLMHVKGIPNWILTPGPDAALGVLARHSVPFDAVLESHDELPSVIQVGERHPSLRIILDHLGKPPIGLGDRPVAEWRSMLVDLAANPHTFAKVSGLYPGGDRRAWTTAQIEPLVHIALDVFGPDRLMYGGDWPLAILAGGIDKTFEAIRSATAHLSHDECESFFSGTAARAYRLAAPRVSA